MKNQMAMDLLNRWRREGLDPTPEDVIRLNAFGLRLDEAQGKRADDAVSLLPRVAWLADGVFFRQPTVGHEIWLKSVLRFADSADYETILALNCFALSRPADELPDACDPSGVKAAAAYFAKRMSRFTKEQLYRAVAYVRFGLDESSGEKPAAAAADPDAQSSQPTADDCIAVASLVNGVSYLWGLSLADIKALTREQLNAAVRAAIVAHGLEIGRDGEFAALDEFNAVADEIHSRLMKSKSNE